MLLTKRAIQLDLLKSYESGRVKTANDDLLCGNEQEADSKLWEIVQAELDKGEIEGYGKELLIKYFRTRGVNTSRYCILLF